MKAVLLFIAYFGFSAACPQGAIYDSTFNRCYLLVSQATSFLAAEQNCIAKGGHLASIENGIVNGIVAGYASDKLRGRNYWIGYTLLLSSRWSWTDNSTFGYDNWMSGQPVDPSISQCVAVEAGNKYWYATTCNTMKPYVCVVSTTSNENSPTTTNSYEAPTCPTCPVCPSQPKTTPTSVFPTSMIYTTQAEVPNCPNGWTYFNDTGFCYVELATNRSNRPGESLCIAQNAQLVSIHNQTEEDFVWQLHQAAFSGSSPTIGLKLNFTDGTWYWSDGSAVNYVNWAPGWPLQETPRTCSCLDGFSPQTNYYTKWVNMDCTLQYTDTNSVLCKKRPGY